MRGKRNLTEGPITRTLLVFSLPVLGGNALQSLNLTANQIWVSHTLGVQGVTALGNSNQVMMLMLGSIFGVSMAANILVAQSVGAGNFTQVKKVMGTATTFFFVLASILATTGGLLAPHILAMMDTPLEARAGAIAYLRIAFSAVPFMYFFAFMQMAQRGAGDSTTPFWFMLLAVALDVVLNPLLILGIGPFPRLGVAGSATSTLIGQGVSLVFLIAHLYRKNSVLLLRPGEFHLLKPDFDIMRALVTRGIPMGIQMFVMSGAGIVMLFLVNQYGAITSAAYSMSSMIWSYLQMPTMALGASISSMAAQNVGAGRWDRVARIARSGVTSSLVVSAALATVLYIFNDQVLSLLLRRDSPALAEAHHINILSLWGFVIFSITFALSGVIRSTGVVWVPLIILATSMIAVRIPFAIALKPYLGEDAIWWSFPMGTITSASLTALYYRFGNWRKSRMLQSQPYGQTSDSGASTPAMDPPEEDEEAAEVMAASKRPAA
ncbi:MAG: MATE family efflux transporter [Proteobacteria bacterium]|nr:MATE family efflux transporter [Pseudomonadota bacterium]